MVVTLHDHITSPVVFRNVYLFLMISDVRAPHRNGKTMVTAWLYLSIEVFYLAIHVQQQIMKLQHVVYHTLRLCCIPHLTSNLLEKQTIPGR